jgi:hypothetical protein
MDNIMVEIMLAISLLLLILSVLAVDVVYVDF